MKIDYKLIDLSFEKIREITHSFLELNEHSIKWSIRYYSDNRKDEQDEALGWDEDQFHCFESIILKKFIAGLSKRWLITTKVWCITIIISGCDDIDIYTKRESEATELFEKLNNYIHVPVA